MDSCEQAVQNELEMRGGGEEEENVKHTRIMEWGQLIPMASRAGNILALSAKIEYSL